MQLRINLRLSIAPLLCLSLSSISQKTTFTEQMFKRLDSNQSGWLSGKEIEACGCKSYDTNGDNEVTKEEFTAGKGVSTGITTQKPKVATKATGAAASSSGLRGSWWFTTLLYKNGTRDELRNRQSGLDLKADGTYVINTWLGGSNNMRTVGTYKLTGNKLTLLQKGSAPKVYTTSLSDGGTILTLMASDGSGYKAERGK
ncbi:MAG: hypothetical protein JWP69_1728 [Flaviaesturariibacter sp.]|nr:hypothetical protein [Flaviaesturariibacter sp.]